MDAAPFQWRPLGQILVDRGLLTPDELEEVLLAQQQSGKPLGQIIVDRRLISAPTLAQLLAEQCGVELETDTGFGTGLWSAIKRRHDADGRRRGDLHVVPAPDEPGPESSPAAEQDETDDPLAEGEEPGPQLASPATAEAEEDSRLAELEQARELERLSEELEDREARLGELAARSDEIEVARVQLAEANERVVALEDALLERQRRVEELEAEQHTKREGQKAAPRRTEREAVTREQAKLREGLESLKREQQELASQLDDVRERELALEERAAELADRERDLTEREQAIAGRQRAVLTAAADLEQRRIALEEQGNGVPSSPEVREFAERHLPTPPERPEPVDGYRWNLDTLTRLVEESADYFPDRADEWRYTLFYLRNEARVDGALPRKFDSLVEECFGELLGTITG